MIVPIDEEDDGQLAIHHPHHNHQKPVVQHRAYQEMDYQRKKASEYRTVHEENQSQRLSIKDQVKIIQQQKEEIKRLMKKLLEKGKDLDWTKELLDKQSKKYEAEKEARLSQEHDEQNATPNLLQKIELLEEDARQKNEMIEEMKNEITDARSQAQHSHEELVSLKMDLKKVDDDCDNYRKLYDQAKNHVDSQLRDQAKEFETNQRQQKELISELNAEIEMLTNEAKRLTGNNSRLSEKLKKIVEERDSAEEKLEDIKSDVTSHFKDRIRELEQELKTTKNQLDTTQNELQQLDSSLMPQVNELRAQIQYFRDQKEASDKVTQARIADAETQKEYAQQRLASLRTQFDKEREEWELKNQEQLQRLRHNHEDMNQEMEEKMGNLEKQNRELKEALKFSMADKVTAEQFDAQSQQKIVRLEAELKRVAEEKQSVEVKLTTSEDNYQTLSRNYSALKIKFDELVITAAKATDEVEDLKEENDELERETDKHEAEVKQLREQLRVMRDSHEQDMQTSMDGAAVRALEEARQDAIVWKQKYMELEDDMMESAKALDEQRVLENQSRSEQAAQLQDELAKEKQSRLESDTLLKAELAALKKQLAEAQVQAIQSKESKEMDMKQIRDNALRDAQSKFDRERKALLEKLKVSEAQRTDLERSLEARAKQVKQEAEKARQQAKLSSEKLSAKQKEMEKQEKEAEEELSLALTKLDATETRADAADVKNRDLLRRIAELEEELNRIKQVQMHW